MATLKNKKISPFSVVGLAVAAWHKMAHRLPDLRRLKATSLLVFFAIPLAGCAQKATEEFTVVAYNVENLFDVDGVAMFRDYTQDEADDPFTYNRAKMLTKLQNHTAVLKTFNDGAGPEVILFQEFEADFTPETTIVGFDEFLATFSDTTVVEMIGAGWKPDYAGISSQAWLLKAMDDEGLSGYSVATVPSKGMDSGIAHANAVFSKFPIVSSTAHELVQARDILEVELDVKGHSLWVYVNHWKSGASSPEREPIRVENARVLRALVDARLAEDLFADIIIGGDLNSHYNHSTLFPEMETGINDVLGSQGNELAIRELEGPDLYNLWFEIEPEARYSEVWRGRRGSLMHLLVTRGLYDTHGIQYVDGSFDKLLLPGLNADELGRPLDWNFAGETGGGVTDHLPVYARYIVGDGEAGDYIELVNPSQGDDALTFEMPLGYLTDSSVELEDGAFLAAVAAADIGPYIGKLYQVEAQVLKMRPLRLLIDGHDWSAYAPGKDLQAELKALDESKAHTMIVKFGLWKGNRQFVVEGLRK
jgi:hypothetical protein